MGNEVKTNNISMSEIDDNPLFNFRGTIVPNDVEFLMNDINENGLLQPIVVRPMVYDSFNYRIVAGFSRFLACKLLHWTVITCVVRDCSEEEAMFLNLSENIVRKNLNWMQESKAVECIMKKYPRYTEEFLAEKLGQSRGWVQVRKYALELPNEAQDQIARGNVTYEQIRQIWQMKDPEKQMKAVKKIKEAKERGIKCKLTDPKPDLTVSKVRRPGEMYAMQSHIRNVIGNCFATRCLGWAAGDIPDSELFGDLKLIADTREIAYEMPTEKLVEILE